MTTRTFITILLLAVALPLNELHHIWDDVSYNVSPFWFITYELDVQWFAKFLCDHITDCLIAVALYRVSRMNQQLRIAASVYVFYTVFNLLMFFGWFNKINYLLLYSFFCLIAVVVIFFKSKPYKRGYA